MTLVLSAFVFFWILSGVVTHHYLKQFWGHFPVLVQVLLWPLHMYFVYKDLEPYEFTKFQIAASTIGYFVTLLSTPVIATIFIHILNCIND